MDHSVESTYPERFDITILDGGLRITFYCKAGHKKNTIDIYDSLTSEQALELAWNESRKCFNRCHQCNSWVCDEHYNEDVMKCILCYPK